MNYLLISITSLFISFPLLSKCVEIKFTVNQSLKKLILICNIIDKQIIQYETYLNCPLINSKLCYSSCNSMCTGNSCEDTFNTCYKESLSKYAVRYSWAINSDKVNETGPWSCTYAGKKSNYFVINSFKEALRIQNNKDNITGKSVILDEQSHPPVTPQTIKAFLPTFWWNLALFIAFILSLICNFLLVILWFLWNKSNALADRKHAIGCLTALGIRRETDFGDNQIYSYLPGDKNSIYYDPRKLLYNQSLLSQQTLNNHNCCEPYLAFETIKTHSSGTGRSIGYESNLTANGGFNQQSLSNPIDSLLQTTDLIPDKSYAQPMKNHRNAQIF